MSKVIHKWFWAWEFDKEEKWLAEMAAQGLALSDIGYCRYTFEDCAPGEYTVRLELLEDWPSSAESQKYIKFVEETGAAYIGSVMRWVYFRKKTEHGGFDLYSDNASRIKHLNRLLALLAPLSIANFCIALGNFGIAAGLSSTMNFYCALASLAVASLIAYGFYKVLGKKRRLQKERALFE